MSGRVLRGSLRRALALVLLAGVAVAVPAAGVAGASGGSGASKGTVSVGIICSCSGPLASSYVVGPPAYEAWADATNAAGGINGYKVKVILKDDGSNEGTSLTDAEQLISTDHVVALVDSTNNDTAWATYAQQHDVPVVGGGAVSAEAIINSDFFAAGTTEDVFVLAEVEAAKKVGAKNIGELYCAEAATCQELLAPLHATAKVLGENVVYEAEISASQPNYTAECLAAKQAGAQILSIGEAVSAVEAVALDCYDQGYVPYEEIGDGGVAQPFDHAPGLDTKSIGFEDDIPFFVTDTPGTEAMIKAIKKYSPSILHSPDYNEEATISYVSGLLFGAALKAGTAGKSGPVTTAEIYKGLYAMHDDTLGGMAPPLTFKSGQANPVDCWYWIAIKNHKFTTPYGLAPYCQKPPPGTL